MKCKRKLANEMQAQLRFCGCAFAAGLLQLRSRCTRTGGEDSRSPVAGPVARRRLQVLRLLAMCVQTGK